MTRHSGTAIAEQRAHELRVDIDYFDQRQARDFLAWKLIAYGVPAAMIVLGGWMAFAP